jgi:hypothetical protein
MQQLRCSQGAWSARRAKWTVAGISALLLGAGAVTVQAQNRYFGNSAATAADTGIYIGAGYVRAQVNNVFGTTNYDFKIDDNAWKAILGIRPLPFLAAEANYVDLGHQSRTLLGGSSPSAHAEARAFDLFAVGLLPVGILDLYGKAGFARWELSGNFTGNGNSLFALDRHGTNFAWGAGAQVHFGPIGVRLEYEHFQMPDTDGARLYTAAATFTF